MSEKPTEGSLFESEISRRDLLTKSRPGRCGSSRRRCACRPGRRRGQARQPAAAKKVPTGGTATWALEQDPGGIYPFGATLTINHTANEMMYDALLEWDPKLNIRPALAESYNVVNSKRIVWNLRKGVIFHNGQELTADDVVYSFQQMLNPPLPGTTATVGQLPAIADVVRLSKYQVQMDLKAPDARVYGVMAWGRYTSIVPNNMYQTLNPSTQGIGTGPYMLSGSYVPNDHVNYVKNPKFWKPGLPYMDGINYKIIPDEQTRIAALKAGSIDGGSGLAGQRPLDQRLSGADGAAQPHGRLPRAPVHGQGRRQQAVGEQVRPPGDQPGDQPPEPDRQGLRRVRQVLRRRSQPGTARGSSRPTSCSRTTRSTTCRPRRP